VAAMIPLGLITSISAPFGLAPPPAVMGSSHHRPCWQAAEYHQLGAVLRIAAKIGGARRAHHARPEGPSRRAVQALRCRRRARGRHKRAAPLSRLSAVT
jgi:hypothetical protein